jgi:hypothetical protein
VRLPVLLAVTVVAATLTDVAAGGQDPPSQTEFIAFRVDAQHVIATIKVTEISGKQIVDGLSPAPPARFGYSHFDAPASWRDQVPAHIRDARQWVIHAAPGQPFAATAERVVGGYAQCQEAVGILLRIDGGRASEFANIRARYFVASAAAVPDTHPSDQATSVRALPSSAFTVAERQAFESILDQVLARELPRVRAESMPDRARKESTRSGSAWVRRQRDMDDALAGGRGELRHDIQSFQLAPDGVPVHFVRAEWMVERQQAFAISLWMRGERPIETLQTNLRPASWLRMFEFQRHVARDHLGLVLNVVDRDHDGWGEVIFAQGGYESISISLLEYSPTGFQTSGTEFACGC